MIIYLISHKNSESAIIQKVKAITTTKKVRDVIKGATIKSNGYATFAVIGVENQSEINYAMVVRNMLYDALDYSTQVTEREKKIRSSKEAVSNAEFLSGFTKNSKLNPVFTLVLNWSDTEWDAPVQLKDMFENMDPRLQGLVSDYDIKVLDPHKITDFSKFHTELGDVLEFIKRQNEENYLREIRKEKGEDWKLQQDSVNAINVFTGSNIPIEPGQKEVNMCRATQALIDDGIKEGINLRDTEKITAMLNKGKTPEEIADFCDYPIEQILKVKAELGKENRQ